MMLDTEQILESLGVDYTVANNEACSLCPMHEKRTGRADSNPSWFINLESGMHICFSCGYKGNLTQLVCDVKEFYLKSWGDLVEYDYPAARAWMATAAELDPERLSEILRNLPTYMQPQPKPLEMSDARLAVFVDPPEEELAKRHLTAESAKLYSVLWDKAKKAWILPVREPHFNKLLGWQEKGTVERTFMNRPAGLPKSKTLFGIENQREDVVIVVESPLDCARIASAGIQGAVAICGSSTSDEQIKLLRYSDKVIVAFDNPNVDKAGKKACDEMRKLGSKYGMNIYYFNYGDTNKKDPGDLTDEEIRWGVENAKSSIFGELAYVQRDAKALSS